MIAVPSLAFFKLAGSLGASQRVTLQGVWKHHTELDWDRIIAGLFASQLMPLQHCNQVFKFKHCLFRRLMLTASVHVQAHALSFVLFGNLAS